MKRTQCATAAFSLLTAVFFLTFGHITTAAPGDLDTTFNLTGKRTDGFSLGSSRGRAVALQADGKIVVAGYTDNGTSLDFALIRYNPDGTLDVSFDGDGKLTTSFGNFDDKAYAVAIQSDGKIVAVGASSTSGTSSDFAVARYNTDGSLDSSFDGDGKVITAIGGDDEALALAFAADGKIVIAGRASFIRNDFALARYNPDGSLDLTFDGDGKVTTIVSTFFSSANAVALQADGKIVAAGSASLPISGSTFCLVRYHPNGALDTSFDGEGIVKTDLGIRGNQVNSIAIQPNGKILVAGTHEKQSDRDFAIARYNANGSLDRSFDWDGILLTDLTQFENGTAIAVQSDGKIFVAGYRSQGVVHDFVILRYKSNGSFDDLPASFDNQIPSGGATQSLFGNGGRVFIDFGGVDNAYGMVLDSAGRAIVVGESRAVGESNWTFSIARLLGDSKPTVPIRSVGGRILNPAGRGIPYARVAIADPENSSHTIITNVFGYYRFVDIPEGSTRTISVSAKRYGFTPQTVTLTEDLAVDFHAMP